MSERSDLRQVMAQMLARQPLGASMWIRGAGRSMSPLLEGGDSVRVVRCEPGALRRGDLAALQTRDGGLAVHVVTRTAPIETASFLGTPDAPGEVLGKVVAVRRGGTVVPLRSVARPAVLVAHRALSALRSRQALRQTFRAAQGARWSAPARRLWLGPLELRALTEDDDEALRVFCEKLGLAVPAPPVVAAVRRSGALVAAAGSKESPWVHVLPAARGLGLEQRLLRAL